MATTNDSVSLCKADRDMIIGTLGLALHRGQVDKELLVKSLAALAYYKREPGGRINVEPGPGEYKLTRRRVGSE